jgi:hypothetical protein
MSRSRKKHLAGGITTAVSDKPGKVRANRVERHAVRIAIAADPEREVIPAKREVTNPYAFPKDGKTWYRRDDKALGRK